MYRFVILFILISISTGTVFGQRPIITSYSLQDGMVSNNVRRIFQDSKGFIWIGTWDGVSQYNGHKFINYSTLNGLSHSLVNDFFEVNGKVFITLQDGSIDCIRDGRISKFAHTADEPSELIRLSADQYIIPTTEGIYKYGDGSIVKPKQEKPDLRFEYMIQLNDSLFLGAIPGYTHKLVVLGKDYRVISFLPIVNDVIRSLYKDSKNRIWFCTESGLRLITFDPHNLTCKIDLPPAPELPSWAGSTCTYFIREEEGGWLWMGTSKGLAHIDPKGNYDLYTEKDGLPSTLVSTMFIDKEKNLWLGTTNGLAKITSRNGIVTIAPEEVRELNDVKVVMPIGNDRLLIAGRNGPQLYNQQTKKIKGVGFSGEIPTFLIPGSNPVIFCSNSSVGYYDTVRNRIIPLTDGKFEMIDHAFCMDKKGNTFFGFPGGIAVVTGKKVRINYNLPDRISCLTVEKDGTIWAGTWLHGLYRITYTIAGDSLYVTTKDLSRLIPDKFIRSLFTDKEGNVWVGTRYHGAYRLAPGKDENFTVSCFDQQQGMSSNFIKSFAETINGDMWVGTFYGLNKLVKEKNTVKVFNFSRVANFFQEIFQVIPAGNNEWWCVASHKIVRIKDQNLEKVALSKAVITAINLGKQQDRRTIYNPDSLISLSYSQNHASFEFSSPGFINEKQNQYSYRLQGSGDTTWSIPANLHEVTYASLQPGDYTFEVRSIGWDGEAGSAASFNFNIQPPFWKTVWFSILVIALIAALFYILYRYRIRQIQRVQQVRNRIATDLHDDIGSTLTNISILTELSQKSRSEPAKSDTYLDRIKEEIDASGQALDDIIWSVNSKNDTLQETAARMRRYAAELFDARNISYELIMDPELEGKKILMEQRRDLYLIFKEALNNIQKHAGATTVSISIYVENDSISLDIRDNGKGYNTAQQTHRNGVINMKERVKRWRGSLQVQSGEGDGTVISVKLPLSRVTQKRD